MNRVDRSKLRPEWNGSVAALYIAPFAGAPMIPLQEAHLVAGRGIEGDRYYLSAGTHSGDEDEEPSYEVTLIESETIKAVQREKKVDLDAGVPRRNIVTQGFGLNHLVHRTFRIGEVIMRGIALREPCPNLADETSHGLMVSLLHRGGLGAQILKGGIIHVGDMIEEVHLEEERKENTCTHHSFMI